MQTETNMKVCSSKVKDVVKVFITFLKDKSTKENGIMAKYKALAYANGLMGNFMKVIGSIIKKVDKASINGLMEDNIKAVIEMIKNMVKGHIYGLMVENILENGRMIKGMEKAST